MSAAQLKAQANFKKAIAYRKKTGCTLKQAFAHVKGSKVNGLDKVVKKGNKTSVQYTKKAKKKAAPKKKVSQGVLFGIKEYNIKDENDNYFYLSLKTGKPAFSNSPDRANIFTADEAIKVKARLKKEGYTGLSVVKYNKDWYKMGSIKKVPKKKTTKTTHKDTKSHNVNIKVMSGLQNDIFRSINNYEKLKVELLIEQNNYKKLKDRFLKSMAKTKIDRLKYELRERKFVLTNLNKELKNKIK